LSRIAAASVGLLQSALLDPLLPVLPVFVLVCLRSTGVVAGRGPGVLVELGVVEQRYRIEVEGGGE
jgi:hypothetical protein